MDRVGTGKHQAVSQEEAEASLRHSRQDLTMEAISARVEWLEREIGEPPHPLRGHPGSGLWQALDNLGSLMRKFGDEMGEMRRQREMERAAEKAVSDQRAAATAPYSRVAWIAIGAAVTVLVGGSVTAFLAWLAGFHR